MSFDDVEVVSSDGRNGRRLNDPGFRQVCSRHFWHSAWFFSRTSSTDLTNIFSCSSSRNDRSKSEECSSMEIGDELTTEKDSMTQGNDQCLTYPRPIATNVVERVFHTLDDRLEWFPKELPLMLESLFEKILLFQNFPEDQCTSS